MFHSFQEFEQKTEDNWRNEEDPLTNLDERVDRMIRQLQILELKRREGSQEGWSQHQAHNPYAHYSNRAPHNMEVSNSGMDELKHQTNVVNNAIREACGAEWREPETSTWAVHHGMRHAGNGMPPAFGAVQSTQCTVRSAQSGVRSAQGEIQPALDNNREAYNSDLTDNSYFSWCNQSLMSQPDHRSTQ